MVLAVLEVAERLGRDPETSAAESAPAGLPAAKLVCSTSRAVRLVGGIAGVTCGSPFPTYDVDAPRTGPEATLPDSCSP